MADTEKYVVEMEKSYSGYCTECGRILELEPPEMEETTCPCCGVSLAPYCDDD